MWRFCRICKSFVTISNYRQSDLQCISKKKKKKAANSIKSSRVRTDREFNGHRTHLGPKAYDATCFSFYTMIPQWYNRARNQILGCLTDLERFSSDHGRYREKIQPPDYVRRPLHLPYLSLSLSSHQTICLAVTDRNSKCFFLVAQSAGCVQTRL